MIDVDDGGRIRRVTLARPEARNALTSDGLTALERAIADADAPVVALCGAGPAFCAGADLDEVAGLDREAAIAFARRGQRVADAIESSEAVVVCEIDGAARGGGVELALACDVRVATPTATLGEPGVGLGLFGAWGGTRRLPRIVGEGHALDLTLSGRVVDAEEALRMGLVSRVVDEPATVTEEIAANPPDALATIKRRIRDEADSEVRDRRDAEAFADLVEAHGEEIGEARR